MASALHSGSSLGMQKAVLVAKEPMAGETICTTPYPHCLPPPCSWGPGWSTPRLSVTVD